MGRSVFAAGIVAGIVALALALTALDVLVERAALPVPDLLVDGLDRLLLLGAAVGSSLVAVRLSQLSRRTEALEFGLDRAAAEGRAWRMQNRRFLDGLSRCIEDQFETWGLTPAEADVAGLLLKGATLREIAILRRTSEATIRQQAGAVYRKSGLGSRSELSAYFLEDLFTIGEATLGGRDAVAPAHYDA